MTRRTRRRAAASRAQTLMEFALILPVITLIIFGLVDIARMMQASVTIQEGARDGARYAITGRIDCTTSGVQDRPNCIRQAVIDRTKSIENASSVVASFKSWGFPAYADPPVAGDAGDQCDAVEVDVAYTYRPVTPIFNFFIGSVNMRASERMVNEPFGTCS
ncbi:MAG: pilus assembly protein [Chloroflexi bacterium]|nr:pilus assembly protein [Chloroflexota bacterium]